MAEALRLFFLAFYAIGVLVLILRVLPLAFAPHPPNGVPRGEPLPALLPSAGRVPDPSGRHAHTHR